MLLGVLQREPEPESSFHSIVLRYGSRGLLNRRPGRQLRSSTRRNRDAETDSSQPLQPVEAKQQLPSPPHEQAGDSRVQVLQAEQVSLQRVPRLLQLRAQEPPFLPAVFSLPPS